MIRSIKSGVKNQSFTLGVTTILLMLGLTVAKAADISTGTGSDFIEPKLDPVATSSIWNGAYAGLYGGVNWNSVGVMGSNDVDLNNNKEIGGYLGFNQQIGNSLVAGIEVLGGYSGEEHTGSGFTAIQDWESSLRARMGYAFEQNLVYGLAGVGATQLELSNAAGSDTNWMTGWSVGAGIERQFTNVITGRVEYDYTDYGQSNFNLGGTPTNADITGHGIKVGIGMNF